MVAEKLMLTGFLALVDPGSWTQLFAGAILTCLAFALQAHVAPYRTRGDNLFAFIASLALVCVFLGSLSLRSEATIAHYSGFGTDSTDELALLFKQLDPDGSNAIEYHELRAVLESVQ